jgi:tRNA(adenine34) deaminase
MWDSLSLPWQAALEMAWEAYCNGTVPIGAVIADADGNIVSRGRNRIQDESLSAGQISSNNLAHAEINALLSLKLNREDARQSALYTTMEPCPLCMGALYMSDVKTLHFAARDPWSGSTNLLNATPYLSQKPVKVFAPYDAVLEDSLIALHTEYKVHQRGEQGFIEHPFFDVFRAVLPNAIEKGIALHRSGELRAKQKEGLPANEAFNWLANQVQ